MRQGMVSLHPAGWDLHHAHPVQGTGVARHPETSIMGRSSPGVVAPRRDKPPQTDVNKTRRNTFPPPSTSIPLAYEAQNENHSIRRDITPCSSPRRLLVPKKARLNPARRVTSPCRGALPQPVPVLRSGGAERVFFSSRPTYFFLLLCSVHTPLRLRGRQREEGRYKAFFPLLLVVKLLLLLVLCILPEPLS